MPFSSLLPYPYISFNSYCANEGKILKLLLATIAVKQFKILVSYPTGGPYKIRISEYLLGFNTQADYINYQNILPGYLVNLIYVNTPFGIVDIEKYFTKYMNDKDVSFIAGGMEY